MVLSLALITTAVRYARVSCLLHSRGDVATQWRKAMEDFNKDDLTSAFNAFQKSCRFPESVALRILHLAPDPAEPNKRTLGDVVREAARVYTDARNGEIFTSSHGRVLDKNVKLFADLIRGCLREHDEDYVFVQEPWAQSFNTFQINVPVAGAFT